MYRGRNAATTSLIFLPLLASGCVQMTRHSNMMIFGTNTVVGIRAGVNATSIPEVALGYTRQEAVVLPLVANVASVPAKTTTTITKNADGSMVTNTVVENGDANRLEPCNLAAAAGGTAPPNGFLVHPCSLVGINGQALDSYSVLASFGGNFKGSSDGKTPTASAGVAQYFATGIAAQTLALNGGAAVVAVGLAADSSARKTAVLATTDATPDEIAEAALFVKNYNAEMAPFLTKIRNTKYLKREFDTFENTISAPLNVASKCIDADACAVFVKTSQIYKASFKHDPAIFDQAVRAWNIN